METIQANEKSVEHDNRHDKQVLRPRALCTGVTVIPIFAFVLIGLVIFDIIMETKIIARIPESGLLVKDNDKTICTPEVVDPSKIEYHSDHQYYSTLKDITPLPLPVFRDEFVQLCDVEKQSKKLYNYCLPISGRKDIPICETADRMDLLSLQSSKSICYASVLHMIMVEVYEELEATGNVPFLVFGSLLGAVRNQSMIPFTEDADVGFIGELAGQNWVRAALRKKGYHMFFMDIWRVCVAPTHPLAGHLYDPNLPITDNYGAPYLDLYMMKHQGNGDWDLEELQGSNGRILPDNKVRPFSQVTVNGMQFDTVHDPEFFLEEAYGEDYMTPKPREEA
ncbi:hypothetical protein PHYBOEH_006535 [Phytophthora boehmeriae]|uniref:Uncharacterized protein n=1 Tax=Phytophthora boehmeriae TaxID=109152 RepID=A0A8T1WCY1_9STRA|nr:hypothetical protein PHYBOEH_006535 [Phytophthora boehmeriae]